VKPQARRSRDSWRFSPGCPVPGSGAGRLDGLLTAIAIDGKWLRGVLDGQVKLFSAMLRQRKVIIGQVRVPDDTTEVTR